MSFLNSNNQSPCNDIATAPAIKVEEGPGGPEAAPTDPIPFTPTATENSHSLTFYQDLRYIQL